MLGDSAGASRLVCLEGTWELCALLARPALLLLYLPQEGVPLSLFGAGRGRTEVLLRRAQALMRRRQWKRALSALEALLAESPDRAEVRVDYGAVLYHLGRYSEALAELERAVAADESLAQGWLNLAAVANQLGLINRAREALERVAKTAPNMRGLHYNLAILRLKEGKLTEALAELETELSLYPGNAAARSLSVALERALLRP